LYGKERLFTCDSGLEFGELLDRAIHPGRAIRTPDGLDERLECQAKITCMKFGEHWPTSGINLVPYLKSFDFELLFFADHD
jgi:hypothetical protein